MTDVAKFYHNVINDVINGVKDEWVDDGLDLQVLDELKKSWTTKLAQTHVFDQEPVHNPAAHYLNLVQRSNLQIRPSTGVNVMNTAAIRPLTTTGRMMLPAMGLGSANRPPISQQATVQLAAASRLGQSHAPLPQSTHPLVHGGLMSSIQSGPARTALPIHSQQRPILPVTGMPSVSAPQMAALPSGLTGHLVQIGQQTYLVPQHLVGVRAPSHNLSAVSHLLGNIATTTSNTNDLTSFHGTQVDGGNDDMDESSFCETPGSQPTPGIATNPLITRSVGFSEQEDEDDDDDDDFVAATPGLAPGSVRPHFAHRLSSNAGQTYACDTPLTGPPTPMSPPSVASRTPYDTPTPRQLSHTPHIATRPSSTATHRNKRRKQSNFSAVDTDTDDDDIGDEVELMSNATMTPAVHGTDYGDDEDEDELESKSQRRKRPHTNGRHSFDLNNQSDPISPDATPADRSAADNELAPDIRKTEEEQDREDEEEEDDDPLNSGDDVSDEEAEILFESDNVIVCQYDKIHRSRNRWRFHLKDGIMSINGRDHVFQKALGEGEW